MSQKSNFLTFGVLPAIMVQSLGALIYFVLLDGSNFAQTAYLFVKISIVGLLIFWLARRPPITKYKFSFSWLTIGLGLLVGLGLSTIIFLVAQINWASLLAAAPAITQKISSFPILDQFFLGSAIAFSLLHSLFEEWYWRWFVGRGLELYFSAVWSIIIGNLAFTAHHVIILSQFFSWPMTIFYSSGIFLAGVVWTKLYLKTSSLTASWLSHALVDLVIFIIIYKLIF